MASARRSTLRHIVVDRIVDPERSFRTALIDLRHGVEVVRVLRDVVRRELLFGLIRWCDDWLAVRRTLVARTEAQLAWYVEHAHELDALTAGAMSPEDWHADRSP